MNGGTTRDRQVEKDLGRDLQEALHEVFARKLKLAEHVLPPPSLAIVTMEATVSFVLSAFATMASATVSPDAAAAIFDKSAESLAVVVSGERERTLAAVANAKAQASRPAA